MVEKRIYSVARCPSCNILQTIQFTQISTAVLRCRSCNKQTKLHKADGTVIELHGFYNHPYDASEQCKELKVKKADLFKSANLI
ncbi:MAG: hypothetical protein Q8Q01_02695 [archaeon]|nr:hypothetical protein [archaeon]